MIYINPEWHPAAVLPLDGTHGSIDRPPIDGDRPASGGLRFHGAVAIIWQ
jgi:hypothetical protein